MKDIVHLVNIEKSYDTVKALSSVTLKVDTGQILTLVGLNGSGKTTLLRILAGLEKPDKGYIQYNKSRLELEELRKISTLVFQKTVMFNKNVYDNVAYGLTIRGFSKEERDERVLHELEMVGLVHLQKRKAKQLSGGEQQRVALARAFVLKPKILLLDEPTANLDPSNAIILENAIKQMKKREECILIISTHNLYQAKRISDTIAHIHYGNILEIADSQHFFSHPKNQITKQFINGELQF